MSLTGLPLVENHHRRTGTAIFGMMCRNAATCASPIPFRSSDSLVDLDGILLEAGAQQ